MTPAWPDTTIDRQAWQIACNELPDADLHTLVARAQELKVLMTPKGTRYVDDKIDTELSALKP
jgi:hypothetical protein